MEEDAFNLMADMLSLTQAQQDGNLDDELSLNLHNRIFFRDAINHNYNEIAERYHCSFEMSERRMIDAYDYWQEDAHRTLTRGIDPDTSSLDHFKHAAFIAFWLRRTHPANKIEGISPVPRDERGAVADFFRYGNEICALFIGFQICLFYEAGRGSAEHGEGVFRIAGRQDQLKRLNFPPGLLHDFATILKHKNMSPHAIYLLYKSLFNTLIPASG